MGKVYALFVIITLKGASKLYFTQYSFVVIILSMRVCLSLHVLPFYVFFVFYVFFFTSFEFDVIFIQAQR